MLVTNWYTNIVFTSYFVFIFFFFQNIKIAIEYRRIGGQKSQLRPKILQICATSKLKGNSICSAFGLYIHSQTVIWTLYTLQIYTIIRVYKVSLGLQKEPPMNKSWPCIPSWSQGKEKKNQVVLLTESRNVQCSIQCHFFFTGQE